MRLEEKLSEAREKCECAIEAGWKVDILNEEYPVQIIFKNDEINFLNSRVNSVVVTCADETVIAVDWDNVDVKEVNKLKKLAEEYAALFYQWFFMNKTQYD